MRLKFSTRLRELRIEKHVTQEQLGDNFHVSQVTVSHWENGTQEPSFQILLDIADYFNVTTDYLLGREF